jgi:(E)-4-hydroxy-3-methylbut-2-enyl-diphosphate synthase
MQLYCESIYNYKRLKTREVKIGELYVGNLHPISVQTMTTTNSMDTFATVDQAIRCIIAGADLVRITAPSKREAENLLNIKNELRKRGYTTPIVADIHFTPNAAEIAARIVEKVRINPGNYIDKKKFEFLEYTDAEYNEELIRIRERFSPLIEICKKYGTAMRIGTNHGSLSDRIMSRYGDTPMGMVESAMEFLRVAREENYHNIVLSMKSSNPLVMVEAYRLLIQEMNNEFNECYPLHLGVTEAGDGEDARIKSAIGIGTLLEDGLGDTIRVSLTEDPEFEIPVCKDLVKRYERKANKENAERNENTHGLYNRNNDGIQRLPYSPFAYCRRPTFAISNIGKNYVPVVIADFEAKADIIPEDLSGIGYTYDKSTDKWKIGDGAADYIFIGRSKIDFYLPGTLKVICDYSTWLESRDKEKYYPLFKAAEFNLGVPCSTIMNFIAIDPCDKESVNATKNAIRLNDRVVLCVQASVESSMADIRSFAIDLMNEKIHCPIILSVQSFETTIDEQLIHFSTEAGALLLDGIGDGIWLRNSEDMIVNTKISGRTYLTTTNNSQFLNNTAFSILQAARTRISKTEYISCPSCGRTLFDLQETTAKIRAVTNHLKGLKIAIMGCIVNGPGEMADADFGYVGSGLGKITLYKGKEIVKRNISHEIAVDELIGILKENNVWIEPSYVQ